MRPRLAIATLAALAFLPPHPAQAQPRPWSEALAADSDTVVFLAGDGALWRAPFHLESHEVLWTPRPGEHVVRFSASPDGHHVAFISRIAEEDTSWMWIGGPDRPTIRAAFAPLLPYRWGHLHFEPPQPTLSDHGIHGGRLLQAGRRQWARSTNTLAWTPDARGVVFGYNDGIAFADPDSANAVQVSRALPMELVMLDPAPIVLVDAVVLREGRGPGPVPEDRTLPGMKSMNEAMVNPTIQGEAWYLLYPAAGQWRAFPASGLTPDRSWTASESSVWWVVARPPSPRAGSIRAIRAHDPTPTPEVDGGEPVTWLGFDAATRSLLWSAGAALRRIPENGGPPAVVLATARPIDRVLPAGAGRYAVCTRDSLLLVDVRAGTTHGSAFAGPLPDRAVAAPSGDVVLVSDGTHDHDPAAVRLAAGAGTLERLTAPAIRNGRWVAAPGGAHLLLFAAGARAPSSLQVLDVGSGRWTEVANPGITAWEQPAP